MRATLPAEIVRFACDNGTRLGRPVLPLVCSTSATSSIDGAGADRGGSVTPPSRTTPASLISAVSTRARPAAAARAASAPSGGRISTRASVSSR